jgi:hypothetical protein
MNFVATTNSEGAGSWTDDLNEYFRDRHVYIHEDNDEQGRRRVQRIARALHPIAASVRIIRLPGLKQDGDVSDWLESDRSGFGWSKSAKALQSGNHQQHRRQRKRRNRPILCLSRKRSRLTS